MKKSTKILTLILSCLLLIGSAVGISVAAETTPSVTIAAQNISYEGAVRVAYYIDGEDTLATGQSIKVLSFNAPFAVNIGDVYNSITATNKAKEEAKVFASDVTESITITGKGDYKLGYSYGVEPKNLRQDIYSVAVVVNDSDGTIVSISNKKLYSPYTYAMNRFNTLQDYNPTGEDATELLQQKNDQLALYTALLDYGAAVQAVLFTDSETGAFNEDALKFSNGWADAYYEVTEKTKINTTESEVTTKYYRGIDYPDAYTVVADKFTGSKSTIFTGFTDLDGNYLYDSTTNYVGYNQYTFLPGRHECVLNYADANGKYNTYDYGTELEANDVSSSLGTTIGDGLKWAFIGGDETNGYIEYGKTVTGQGAAIKLLNSATSTVNKVSSCYVFDFDFNVNNTGNTGTDSHIGQFWIDGHTGGQHLWGVNIYGNQTEKNYTIKIDNGSRNGETIFSSAEGANITAYDTWHNIRLEYYTNLGELYTQLVKLYFDGELVGEYSEIYSGNVLDGTGFSTNYVEYSDSFNCAHFNMNYASTGTTFKIDNAFLGTVEKDFVFGQGYYANNFNGADDFENITTANDLGWTTVQGFGNEPTTWEDLIGDGTATKTGHQWTLLEKGEDGNTTINIGKVNNYKTVQTSDYYKGADTGPGAQPIFQSNDTIGDTYIWEADFKWNYNNVFWNATKLLTADGDKWGARFEFRSTAATGSNFMGSVLIYCDMDNGNIWVGNRDEDSLFKMGEWFNLRFEYTPTGKNSDGKYTSSLKAYANGRQVYATTFTNDYDNTDFTGVAVETRGYALDASWSIDNLFVGAVGTRGDYSYGADVAGTVIDYADNNTGYETGDRPTSRKTDTTTNGDWAGVHTLNGDEYLQFGQTNKTAVKVHYPLAEQGTSGDTYIFGTDFAVLSTKNCLTGTGKSDPWVAKLAMFSGVGDSDYFYAIFAYVDNLTVKLAKNKSADPFIEIPLEQWTNVHIEYTPTGRSGDSYTGDVKIICDQVTVYEESVSTSKDNTTFQEAYVEARQYVTDVVIGLDNTYVNAVETLTEDFSDATAATNKISISATAPHITVTNDVNENGVLNFHLDKNSGADGGWTTGERRTYYIFGDIGKEQVGTVYTVDYKIRLNEFKNNTANPRNWWLYIGLLTDATMGTNDFESRGLMYTGGSINTATNEVKIGSQVLEIGKWVDVRYVYAVTAIAEDGTLTMSGSVYVNGVRVGTNSSKYPENTYTDIIGIGFKTAGYSSSNGMIDDISFDVDDIKVRVFNTVAE